MSANQTAEREATEAPAGLDLTSLRMFAARRGTLLAVGSLLVALPFLAAVWQITFAGPDFQWSGDQALVQINTSDAAHFRQLLGAYSRCGWSDPGPAWFYLLVPVYVLGGGSGASLEASQLVLEAAAMCLCLVAATWNRGRLAIVVATAVLCYFVHALGPAILIQVWNPMFLIGPALLMLLLCARAASGSLPSWCGALLAGTVIVQAHVATAPCTILLLLVSGVACLRAVRASLRHSPAARFSRRWIALASGAAVTAVAAWVPPLIEQLSYRNGNFGQLASYARSPMSDNMCTGSGATNTAHGLGESISVTMQGMTIVPFPHTLPPVLTGSLTAGSAWTLTVYLLFAATLVLIAARTGDRVAAWTGAVALLATFAAVFSTMHANGPLEFHLVVWYSSIPVAAALGWVLFAADARRLDPTPLVRRLSDARARGALFGAAAVVATGSLAATTLPMARAVAVGDHPASAIQLDALVRSALPARPPAADRRVLIVIASHDAWWMVPTAIEDLRHRGWEPEVTQDWEFMFGHRYALGAGERPPRRVVMVTLSNVTPVPAANRVVGSFQDPVLPAAEGDVVVSVPGKDG